jgi:hypothetical protein
MDHEGATDFEAIPAGINVPHDLNGKRGEE